ncbi:MAG: hypothetical protein R3B13_13500 [Polyangiaceae bacterium]
MSGSILRFTRCALTCGGLALAVGCGSSASNGAASGGGAGIAGSGAAAGASGGNGGSAGLDAGGGAAGDGSTADSPVEAGPDLKGWTEQASFQQIVVAGGWNTQRLYVDPHTSGRVAFEFTRVAGQAWFLIWENGTFSKKLEDDSMASSDGAGFDALGHFYLYFRTNSDAFVAQWPNVNKSWDTIKLDVPTGYYPSWPPTALSVAMGSVPRVGLYSGDRVFDATGKVDSAGYLFWQVLPAVQWQPGSLDGYTFTSLDFVPGTPNDFYVTVSNGSSLARCSPSGLDVICTELQSFPSAPSALWLTPANPDLLYLRVKNAKGDSELQLSTDGGKSSTPLTPPFGAQSVNLALSPSDEKTLVAWRDGNSDLQVSHDQGVSWNPVPLPQAMNTSLTGAGIDKAGTLFLVRGDALFSRTGY